jgi:hypothetical protein
VNCEESIATFLNYTLALQRNQSLEKVEDANQGLVELYAPAAAEIVASTFSPDRVVIEVSCGSSLRLAD